ncbi:MAG: hypothetical protein IM613_12760 [Cytophagales bacterium]|nr:hypothetical protein [Cytophagales bacterium]
MYIHSDFAEEQQEDRRKKGWVMPVLTAGTLLAGGLAARSLLKDAIKAPPGLANPELAKKSVDEAKIVIKDQIDKNYKSGVASVGKDIERLKRRRRLLAEVATKQRNNTLDVLDIINDKNKNNQYSLNPLYGSKRNGGNLSASRVLKNRKLVEQARELAKSRGLEYSMRYTTTANFAMAGTMGGINSGVLSKITGDLGQTVQKAKNWLQKAGQAKQEVAARTIKSPYALKRATPLSSSNQKVEEMIRQKYGLGVKPGPSYDASNVQNTLNKSIENKQKSNQLRQQIAGNNYKQVEKLKSYNYAPTPATNPNTVLQSQPFLRLRSTLDPRTGKLVSAAYKSPISFLCDL